MNNPYKEILNTINALRIIDTHEHLPSYENLRNRGTDILKEYLSHYFNRDLLSSGLPFTTYRKIIEDDIPIIQKWKLIEPYWNMSKFTGYGQALEIAAKDIYGINKINADTIEELNYKFLQSLKQEHFKKILKDMCKIETSLLTTDFESFINPKTKHIGNIICDKNYYSPVYSIDNLIQPLYFDQIDAISNESGIKITSFSRLLEAIEALIEKAYSLGAVALKNALAYRRTLKYERVTKSQAEEDFNNIFKTKHFEDWTLRPIQAGKNYQDYIFHHILDIANKENLIIQIHTGIQEGSGNIISNSNPVLLSNIFLEYPEVTFDIFHMSYPYQGQLIVLAKNFPNVYIDMCWAHLISPNAARNFLLECIDTVPINKISAFGGDLMFIDGVYGHLTLARRNIAEILSKKVEENFFDLDTAKQIAKLLLYDNPKKLFRL